RGGLILDLRGNGGGRGFHMSRVAGALLGGGVRIGTTRSASVTQDYTTLRLTDHYQGPVVLLVGQCTASAAEITAAAVQDLKRGKLVGGATSGAVLLGNNFEL